MGGEIRLDLNDTVFSPASSGRHVKYEKLPLNNLYLSMLDRMGVPTDSLGDSTGRLPDLWVRMPSRGLSFWTLRNEETLAPPGVILPWRGGGPSSIACGRAIGRRETCPG
jgi:hypothetical protein